MPLRPKKSITLEQLLSWVALHELEVPGKGGLTPEQITEFRSKIRPALQEVRAVLYSGGLIAVRPMDGIPSSRYYQIEPWFWSNLIKTDDMLLSLCYNREARYQNEFGINFMSGKEFRFDFDVVMRLWEPNIKEPADSDNDIETQLEAKVGDTGRARGRKPTKGESVRTAMRQAIRGGILTTQALNEMTEKAMEHSFGASRDTCRKARAAVLSEMSRIDLPTNDKWRR